MTRILLFIDSLGAGGAQRQLTAGGIGTFRPESWNVRLGEKIAIQPIISVKK